ncbi:MULTISPECIES: PepSY-associated TM helix domain-containing protein [unclassified Colwellia]|uniref:PepSY-associated TM helix domain-containing protein n=1 Tax=unclassified Colwellia TaxID=196834 RepID=UPI00087894A4|nr:MULTISPECIES: PepSY-associated TM helix domain-containing protein [unclassified Colwellia]MBA6351879.1 PepSY-associated TM helix domain-containing protein [Colwellia sp. BRX9-1]MBA6355252.1 PepSY-associated TM helix domain-containing protein [Colwellia sp. BRX8-3]MBA6358884.1 PepSY-associated TM helix domain-containing protein [Colwellia sp. BRX8-6]MBA6366398.1 PepSY-associated TM helix domain-containing protein [Colwellia sp. BRX8-5]MBA6374285.1 PepSY-associated TM helix domain-containing 
MQINKSTLSFSRLIHVYVSMALLSLLLFFSVTGITLNHPEWFRDSKADVVERALMIDLSMIKNPPLTPLQIVNVSTAIEQKLSVSLNNTILESSQDELFFSIKRAGKNTAITLDLVSGELFFEETDYGWWALMNDLHKGRNTSVFWGWIIDITSLLCILFALSGFILAMPQRRFNRTLTVSLTVTVAMISTAIWWI